MTHATTVFKYSKMIENVNTSLVTDTLYNLKSMNPGPLKYTPKFNKIHDETTSDDSHSFSRIQAIVLT